MLRGRIRAIVGVALSCALVVTSGCYTTRSIEVVEARKVREDSPGDLKAGDLIRVTYREHGVEDPVTRDGVLDRIVGGEIRMRHESRWVTVSLERVVKVEVLDRQYSVVRTIGLAAALGAAMYVSYWMIVFRIL